MSFQGMLTEIQFADIIQLMCSSGKTGVFRLEKDHEKASVFLLEGDVVHAEVGELCGEQAVYSLVGWRTGSFEFQPGITSDKTTVKSNFMNLLMEAARRQDEWEVIRLKIPDNNSVPDFVVHDSDSDEVTLNTHEWTILSKINGLRTVREIAEESNRDIFEVSKVIYGLLSNKLIELKVYT